MAPLGFGDRLGYLRWLSHLVSGEVLDQAEIGRMVGAALGVPPLTGQSVGNWLNREEAPNIRTTVEGLAKAFGVSEAWLTRGEGLPPRPDAWALWSTARASSGAAGGRTKTGAPRLGVKSPRKRDGSDRRRSG